MKIAVLVLLVAFANAEGDVMKDMPIAGRKDIPLPPGFGPIELKTIPVAPFHGIPEAIRPEVYVNKPLYQLKTAFTSETPAYTKPVEPVVVHSGVRVLDTTLNTAPYGDSLRSALFGSYYAPEAGYHGYSGQYYMGGKPLTKYLVDKAPYSPYYYAPPYAPSYAPSAYALPVADYRYDIPSGIKPEVTGMGGQFYGSIPLLKGTFYGNHESVYPYMPVPAASQYAPYYYYYNRK